MASAINSHSESRDSTPAPAGRRGPDLRLAVPAALLWAAAAAGIADPAAAGALAVAIGITAAMVATAAVIRHGDWLPTVAAVMFAAAVGLSIVAAHGAARSPADLGEALRSGRPIEAVATTAEPCRAVSQALSTRLRCPATATDVVVGDRRWSGLFPIAIFTDEEIEPGTSVRVTGGTAVQGPEQQTAIYVFAESVEITAAPAAVQAWASGLRHGLRSVAAQLPGGGAELLPGLAVGDTSAVSVTLGTAMREASLSHLTAVSGANCAVIVGLVLMLGRLAALPRAVRLASAGMALALFVVVVTPQPSVLRAALMAVIVLLATLVGRSAAGLSALGLAVIIVLVADPWLSRDFGFILSVFATLGLLVLARPIGDRLSRWMPEPLAMAIAIPIAAQLACQPVLLLLTPGIPLGSVLANLLAAGAAPVATILGLLVCVSAAVLPIFAVPIGWLAWLPATWIAAVAHFFGEVVAVRVPWLAGAPGALSLAVVTVIVVTAALTTSIALRRVLLGITLIVAACWLGAVVGTQVSSGLNRPADWTIAQCDVGQGDASVLRRGDLVAMIDTGPSPGLAEDCLRELGIDTIDLLVLTHFDRDHVGGAGALLGRASLVIHGPVDGANDEALLARFRAAGSVLVTADESVHGSLGDLRWRVLWPRSNVTVEPGNPASVVVAVEGDLDAIFLGDLGAEAQRALRRSTALMNVDVVKVAHHGSADQDPAFYAELGADAALIGVGADNGYGHPTDALLGMLDATGTRAFRTDQDGLLLVAAAPEGLRIWSER